MLTRTILALSLAAFSLAVPVAQPRGLPLVGDLSEDLSGVTDFSGADATGEFCLSQQCFYKILIASNKVDGVLGNLPVVGPVVVNLVGSLGDSITGDVSNAGDSVPVSGSYALPSL